MKTLLATALLAMSAFASPSAEAGTRELDVWICMNRLSCSSATGSHTTFVVDSDGTLLIGGTQLTWIVDRGRIWIELPAATRRSYYYGEWDPATGCISGTVVFGFNRGTWGGCVVP